jgi:hypothetical protein
LPEFHKPQVRQAHNVAFAIHHKFGVDGIAVPRSDGVPDVRETATKNVTGKLGGHIERANELVHGAGIGKHWK